MNWLRHSRFAVLAGALALGGSSIGDPFEPLDGGYRLQFEAPGDMAEHFAADPCYRIEKGLWHYSAAHCEEMMPLETVTGVLVTGFEERSFLPGATSVPHGNDPRRYGTEVEIDHSLIDALPGRADAPYVAVLVTFKGRRMRYPYSIDCGGRRSYVYVVHQLYSARHLGAVADPDQATVRSWGRETKPFKRSGEGGKIAEMEEEALKRCFGG